MISEIVFQCDIAREPKTKKFAGRPHASTHLRLNKCGKAYRRKCSTVSIVEKKKKFTPKKKFNCHDVNSYKQSQFDMP